MCNGWVGINSFSVKCLWLLNNYYKVVGKWRVYFVSSLFLINWFFCCCYCFMQRLLHLFDDVVVVGQLLKLWIIKCNVFCLDFDFWANGWLLTVFFHVCCSLLAIGHWDLW